MYIQLDSSEGYSRLKLDQISVSSAHFESMAIPGFAIKNFPYLLAIIFLDPKFNENRSWISHTRSILKEFFRDGSEMCALFLL